MKMLWIYKRLQFKELTKQYMLLASQCCVISWKHFPFTSKWGQSNKNNFAMPNKSLCQNVRFWHTYNWRVECETVSNVSDELAINKCQIAQNQLNVFCGLEFNGTKFSLLLFSFLVCWFAPFFLFLRKTSYVLIVHKLWLKGKQKKELSGQHRFKTSYFDISGALSMLN